MQLQYLCTNCLLGTLQGGRCTHCGKSANESADRKPEALPDRYLLGNRYYLGKVIGSGGFGITYLAWDCKQKCRVIVKELYPVGDVQRQGAGLTVVPVPGQEEYFQHSRERFREEARILNSFLKEPSIVDVYQLVEANGTTYYTMEYLPGVDMRTYLLQKGTLEWPHLSCYVRRLLYTLKILHEKQLLHRDISPDNIFLTSETNAKLIDFGSVRCYNNGQGLTEILKEVYAPPEQYYFHGNQGPWTDIYALCVTIYVALSGKVPPRAPERLQYPDRMIPIQKLCPRLPSHVSAAIMKGMELRIEKRFQSVDEMAAVFFPGESILSFREKTTGSGRILGSPAGGKKVWRLYCVAGVRKGSAWTLRAGELTIGREEGCSVRYPADSPAVSRKQCTFLCKGGKLMVRDDRSSYGTFVSGRRLPAGQWQYLKNKARITFAREVYVVQSGAERERHS